jgi:hypothetical protein
MTCATAPADWKIVIARMDREMFPQPISEPSRMYCGAAKHLRSGVRVHTGWFDNPVACNEALERILADVS